MTNDAPYSHVQRQVVLPLSKAVEIAYKSIRLRLSRSLVVTSGIVLSLAFLMSILTGEAIVDSMRAWAASPHNATHLTDQRRATEASLAELKATLRPQIATAATRPADPSAEAFNAAAIFAKPLPELSKEIGGLPAPPAEVQAAMDRAPLLRPHLRDWVDRSRELQRLKAEQTAPQQLQAQMKAAGVPTTAQEIADNRIQTRWLLSLALLVAFVGILNAMLMSVTERFREIGTMKCLGAMDGFIVKLFLIESLFQGIAGTTAGVLLGLGLSVVSNWATYGQFTWVAFPAHRIFYAGLFCLAIGIALTVAGAVYPAWQAARMQPIEAMRVEA
jgi:hypothetical protein